MMTTKLTVICDLDLAKKILISDFEKFSDRGHYYNAESDPLTQNLFDMPVNHWRRQRPALQAAFSSGKLKRMTPEIVHIADDMLDTVQRNLGLDVNIVDLCAKYTTDVIGKCAFGLECNSFKKNSKNEFLDNGKLIFLPRVRSIVRLFPFIFGWPSRRLKVEATPAEVKEFYYRLARDLAAHREGQRYAEMKPKSDDFVDALLRLNLSTDCVAAQMFIMQVAGYETTGKALMYTIYELALNQSVQDRLRSEVKQVLERNGGVISYETFFEMPFLDCVINEALRKHPPTRMLTRRLVANRYEIPGTSVCLKQGDLVTIPIYGIHYDPRIYPNPEVYDPERFLPVPTSGRHSMAFLPFGQGFRICIGLRLAMLEIKVALSKVILRYRVLRGSELPDKLKYIPFGGVLTPDGPVNVRFEQL